MFDLADPAVLDGLYISIGKEACKILFFQQAGGDGMGFIVNDHHADAVEVFTGLGQKNGTAVLVSLGPAFDGGVRVTVDLCAQAVGVGNDAPAEPGGEGIRLSQMAKADDHVGAGLLCPVNGLLHGIVQRPAVLAAGNVIDEISVFVLEIGGGDIDERLRRGDAHKGDGLIPKVEQGVGLQHGAAADAIFHVIEIAGDVRVVRPFHGGHAAVHAIVKLVVARSCQVIAGGIHQFNDGLAAVHGAVGGALDVVAGVHQKNVFILGLQLILQRCDHIVAQFTVDIGVNVVGVQDHGVFGLGGVLCHGGSGKAESHYRCHQHSKHSSHRDPPLVLGMDAIYSNAV